jgi:hypothetical protein
MEQYSFAYDEAGEQAMDMKKLYSAAINRGPYGLLDYMRGMDSEDTPPLKSDTGEGMIVDRRPLYA